MGFLSISRHIRDDGLFTINSTIEYDFSKLLVHVARAIEHTSEANPFLLRIFPVSLYAVSRE